MKPIGRVIGQHLVTIVAAVALAFALADIASAGAVPIIGGGTGPEPGRLHPRKLSYVPMFDANSSTTESEQQQAMPTGGTVKNFFVRLGAPLGNGEQIVFTLRIDTGTGPISTIVGCTIHASQQECSDLITGHSVTYNGGDLISVEADPTNGRAIGEGKKREMHDVEADPTNGRAIGEGKKREMHWTASFEEAVIWAE